MFEDDKIQRRLNWSKKKNNKSYNEDFRIKNKESYKRNKYKGKENDY